MYDTCMQATGACIQGTDACVPSCEAGCLAITGIMWFYYRPVFALCMLLGVRSLSRTHSLSACLSFSATTNFLFFLLSCVCVCVEGVCGGGARVARFP